MAGSVPTCLIQCLEALAILPQLTTMPVASSTSHSTFGSNCACTNQKADLRVRLLLAPDRSEGRRGRTRQREFFDHRLPHREQSAANKHKGQTQPQPHPKRSHLHLETKKRTQWKADNPITNEISQHRNAGISGTAKSSGRHDM